MAGVLWLAVPGLALLFFLPGFALTLALFPEWEFRGPRALTRALERTALGFVLSVALTVVVGFLLLNLSPTGFQAGVGDPLLEEVLAGITVVGFAAAVLRRTEGDRRSPLRPEPGSVDPWTVLRALDRLRDREQRLVRRLRSTPSDAPERAAQEQELRNVRAELERVARAREAEYVE